MTSTYEPPIRDAARPEESRVATYRLSGADAQQAVLADFCSAAMVGVSVLGSIEADSPRITVRCRSIGDEVLVDHVVRQIDPQAQRMSGPPIGFVHPSMRATESFSE